MNWKKISYPTLDEPPRWMRWGGFQLFQSTDGLKLFEDILTKNPDIMRVVEIGTACGGLALFFGACVRERGGQVLTIDNQKLMEFGYDKWSAEAPKYNVTFMLMDCFNPESVQKIAEFIKGHRALILCDNGEKKREVSLYVEILKKDDILMAHDYQGEISDADLTERFLSITDPYRQEDFANGIDTRILSRKRNEKP